MWNFTVSVSYHNLPPSAIKMARDWHENGTKKIDKEIVKSTVQKKEQSDKANKKEKHRKSTEKKKSIIRLLFYFLDIFRISGALSMISL